MARGEMIPRREGATVRVMRSSWSMLLVVIVFMRRFVRVYNNDRGAMVMEWGVAVKRLGEPIMG